MKSTIFEKVLNEEYIPVNKSAAETIERLSQLRGATSHGEADVYLNCSKKGKINVGYDIPSKSNRSPENMYQLYKVCGCVIEKDNKTYIKMQSVYKNGYVYLQYALLFFAILLFPFYMLSRIPMARFNICIFAIVILLLALVLFFYISTSISKQKKRGLDLIPAMEEKLKKCVEAIERWDE